MNRDSKSVLILGMHRSGSSCLAGSLSQRGLFLGKVNVKNLHNPKGNRENTAVTHLNESILSASGGSWLAPPDRLRILPEHCENRAEIIGSFLASGNKTWGIKDPRMLLTLEFWLESIPNAQLVGSYRHPLAVARSLQTRSNMTLVQGLNLWWIYNQKLVSLLSTYRFPLISFDAREKEYLESLEQLIQLLGLASATDTSEQPFYTPDLQHQIIDDTGIIDPRITDLYDSLVQYENHFWVS